MRVSRSQPVLASNGQTEAEPSAGKWVLTEHWRGPVARIKSVSEKRITVEPRGHIGPDDVRAVFDTEEGAHDAWRRYLVALRRGQDGLAGLREARAAANTALYEAERRVKAEAWAAALARPSVAREPQANTGHTNGDSGKPS